MKVWIDQDLCTGDGLCEEIAPAVFTLLDDGLAYVKEGDDVKNEPGGSAGMALVPEDLEDAVVEASEECPGRVHLHRARLNRASATPQASEQAPGRGEEPGVGDHPVVGPDRAGFDVPGPAQDLDGLGQTEGPFGSSAPRSCAVWLIVGR